MKKIILLALALAALCSCENNGVTLEEEKGASPASVSSDRGAKAGKLFFYADDKLSAELEKSAGEDGYVPASRVPELSRAGLKNMRRLFPEAGRFEARTRAAGLHRWYVASFDELTPVTKAGSALSGIPGVEKIEYDYGIKLTGDPVVTGYVDGHAAPSAASTSLPFNDPRLSSQWHYYNDGTADGAVSGCDINVFPVWRNYTTGSPDVIVAVVDGGVDFSHEDLAANMWHNPERTGDSQYGYNFVRGNYNVSAESHGTHVAGTIAAVNNNGVGVSGIAGGNSQTGQGGVKIMSCQIFEGKETGSGPEAIKWAADHGAVIAQNSWGYEEITVTPAYLKDAVDYFIRYAGMDENGRQTGPMAGGIVIFAAGNDNVGVSSTSYDPIFNVASVGADYRRAYYSNYGSWVDIAAPGGDVKKGNQVLSTLPGDRYGYMQGTSMACPHVSGVAALILSRNGKTGYTPAALERSLVSGASGLESFNPNYEMGAGLVNAYRSMVGSGGSAPDTPTELSVTSQSNNLRFSVKIPEDADDAVPSTIYIFYDNSDFSSADEVMFGMFYVDPSARPGDVLSGEISGLDFNRTYYVAASACDLAGNMSGLTPRTRVTTGSNSAPVITALSGTSFSIKAHERTEAKFEITEPDGHYYSIDLAQGSPAAVLDTTVRNRPSVLITGADAPAGTYRATLTVTDYYGASASSSVDYTIGENHAPVTVRQIENRIFSSRTAGTVSLDVADYFYDEDGETLKYYMFISDPTVVNVTSDGSSLLITPMNYGYADVTVTGKDVRGENVSQQFKVLVRDGSQDADVYPNPVRDVLKIRTGADTEADVKVIASSGAVIYDKTVTISPFTPLSVDMSDASAGSYVVKLKIGGKETKYNIVKI